MKKLFLLFFSCLTLQAQNVLEQLNVVKQFGADPTGSNECSTAFQQAMNYATNHTGAQIFVPKGTYKLTNYVFVFSNTRIIHEPGATLVSTNQPIVTYFINTTNFGNKTNIQIYGGTLIGHTNTGGPQFGVAINCQNPGDIVRDILIDGMTINKYAFDGILVGGNSNAFPEDIIIIRNRVFGNDRHGLSAGNVKRIKIYDNSFISHVGKDFSCGIDIEAEPSLSDFDVDVQGNYFSSNRFRNLFIQRGNGVETSRIRVANNISEFALDDGINLNVISRASEISGNKSRNNGGYGLNAGQVADGSIIGGEYVNNAKSGIQVGLSQGLKIIGVRADLNSEDGIRINGGGPTNQQSTLNIVANSTIRSNTLTGIRIAGGYANTLVGNTVTYNRQEGIKFEASSQNNSVFGGLVAQNSQNLDNGAANILLEDFSSDNQVIGVKIKKAVVHFYGSSITASNNTVTLSTNASNLDDYYNGQTAYVISGPGSGENSVITDYVGATRLVTVTSAWSTQPTNSVIEIAGASKPAYGIRIGDTNSIRNRIVGNDAFRGGQVDISTPVGDTTTIQYLPTSEGGTGTNDLMKLYGGVGVKNGWFVADNGFGLRIFNDQTQMVNIVTLDAGNNTFILGGGTNGEIHFAPTGNVSTGSLVNVDIRNNGIIRYRQIPTNSIVYANEVHDLVPVQFAYGVSLVNGILNNTGLTNLTVGSTLTPLLATTSTQSPVISAVDLNGPRIWYWNNTANQMRALIPGANIFIDEATDTLSFTNAVGGTNAGYTVILRDATPLTSRTNLAFITGGGLYAEDDSGNNRTIVYGTNIVLTSRSVTTSEGIQGGGTLAADRNLKLDFNGLTEDTNPDFTADFLATYDASAFIHKKVKMQTAFPTRQAFKVVGSGADFNYTLGIGIWEKIQFGSAGPTVVLTNAGTYQIIASLSAFFPGTTEQEFYMTNITDHVGFPETFTRIIDNQSAPTRVTMATQVTTAGSMKQIEFWGTSYENPYTSAVVQSTNSVVNVIRLY